MLSFTSSLSPDSEAFAIFVTEKYEYKDKREILPKNIVQKINSFIRVLKVKKSPGIKGLPGAPPFWGIGQAVPQRPRSLNLLGWGDTQTRTQGSSHFLLLRGRR